MFLFYVLSFFKKGDTIQGGTLFKGGHYLRKYGRLINLHFESFQDVDTGVAVFWSGCMSILCSLAFLSIDQNSQIFFKPGNLNWTYMGELFVLGSLGICAVWMVTVSCQLLDPTINSVKIFLKNKIYFFKFFTNIQKF